MGDLSKNFSRKEFKCKGRNCCNGSAPVHPTLIVALQQLRDAIESPIVITSGFRCNRHNKEVGGVRGSYHTLGMAVDIQVPEHMTAQELLEAATQVPWFLIGGIGVYSTWLHVDVRDDGPARWTI